MKHNTLALARRTAVTLARPTPSSSSYLSSIRYYSQQTSLGATESSDSSKTRRRTVTPFNDDGHVPWGQLSAGEKAARATQQSFNFGLIIAGLVLTGGVTYFLWTDVFSPDSRTSQFNKAVDKIKADDRCVEILGNARKITAHGEQTVNKWRRARPIATSERTDQQGNHHLMMHFHVDGPKADGVAQVHLIKHKGESDFEYKYLFVDVQGHERIYLENADNKSSAAKKAFSMFGIKWS